MTQQLIFPTAPFVFLRQQVATLTSGHLVDFWRTSAYIALISALHAA